MTQKNIELKERFINILKETGRDGIDYVIEALEESGFFEAPASANNHLNVEGGLLEHSLNVYDEAMALKEVQLRFRPSLAEALSDDQIAIASLLHDVCKTDLYKKTLRSRKAVDGTWEKYYGYEIDDKAFPAGHGEKSVIMLLQWGLDMTDDEILAIRWHMSPWDMPFQSIDIMKNYNNAKRDYPLVPIVAMADSLAANILEGKE